MVCRLPPEAGRSVLRAQALAAGRAAIWTGFVTLTTAGSVTITANDGNGHTGTSNSFTVYAAPPALDVSNTASTSGSPSYTVSLTTTKANDILYVAVSTGSSQYRYNFWWWTYLDSKS